MTSGFLVKKAGALSLLQDRGRFGYQALGLTSGGPMDEHAALWANHLLANDINAPLLEITLGNVVLEALGNSRIAVTGADCGFAINRVAGENWSVHWVSAGDRLNFGWMRNGVRCYLAVSGGFRVSPEFGSVSTVVRESIGGLSGAPLKVDQVLPYEPMAKSQGRIQAVPYRFRPDYQRSPLTLRLIPGYQYHAFSQAERIRLFESPYTVLPESDRMGYRLSGLSVRPEVKGILSEGIAYGAVQIPPDGQPIILMKDRQTLGGYPKIGTVLPLDLYALSQSRAGSEVMFERVELDEAQSLMRSFYRFFGV